MRKKEAWHLLNVIDKKRKDWELWTLSVSHYKSTLCTVDFFIDVGSGPRSVYTALGRLKALHLYQNGNQAIQVLRHRGPALSRVLCCFNVQLKERKGKEGNF